MSPRLKKILNALGVVLSAIAIVWIVIKIRSLATGDVTAAMARIGVGGLLLSLLPACLSGVALAIGWVALLELLERRALPRKTLALVYLRTQAGKYLPGKVFQYVLRHAAGRSLHISHSALVQSSLWEAASLVVLAILVSLPYLTPQLRSFVPASILFPTAIAGAALAVIVFAVLVKIRLLRKEGPGQSTAFNRIGPLGRMLGAHVFFFFLSGLSLFVLVASTRGARPSSFAIAAGAWASSWMIAFVTPGLPGGMGVRESVMISVLRAETGEAEAVVLALVLRLITTVADGATWALTYYPPFHARMNFSPDRASGEPASGLPEADPVRST